MAGWSGFEARTHRRVLLVFPKYAKSFGTFDHAFGLLGVRAFMPPQGLLVIAVLLPRRWDIAALPRPMRYDRPDRHF